MVTFPAVSPEAVPVTFVMTPEVGVPRAGATNVLFDRVCARVVNTKLSETPAKSGMVSVVAPEVCDVRAILTACPFVRINGVAADVARDVAEATPRVGVVRTGEVAKTNAPPEPVSSEITVFNSAEVVAANTSSLSPVVVNVPDVFGKVYVRSAVKSTVVMIPAKRPDPPSNGRNIRSSSLAVADRIMRGAVLPVAVKMFCAEVARDVPVATPILGVVRVGEV